MNFLKDVKENWMLILFIGSLIVSWTTFNNRLGAVEVKAQNSADSIESYSQQINTLNANVFIICSSLKLNCIQPIQTK